MKKRLHVLSLILSMAFFATAVKAQSTLIHYWHFNSSTNATRVVALPSVLPTDADYSLLDTSKARIYFLPQAGVSSAYATSYDFKTTGDTLNARLGHSLDATNYYMRMLNPSDSMEARFYLPTTGFKHIALSYDVESSSTGNGAKIQYFDYSIDSGATWQTTGMSVLSTLPNITHPAQDSVEAVWGKIIVTFDSTVNDNSKFVVRLKFGTPNTGTSGNDRFDNVALDGDTIFTMPPPPPPPPADTFALIHYWNFNTLSSAYHNPGIPAIHADFSAIDTSKAKIVYTLDPGTSASYAGYIDNVTGDTLNAKMLQPAGNGLRVRNPSDSMSLVTYIPTTNYKDIHVKYEVSSSSLTSGQLQQLFAYSVDSGATWTTAGLNMTSDSIGVNWTIVGLDFGTDTMVNNNPKLALRIRFAGNTSLTSGNNRFDNFTVEGNIIDTTTPPPPPPPADTFALIHYWNFNTLSSAYHNPGIPAIHADFSAIDTSKAKIVYTLDPGTSASYAGYIDNVTGDTLNAKQAAPAGNGLRVRNPSDSMSLVTYIPTTNYKDIHVKYEVSSSSLTSGQLQELFDYSVDSGATWTTAGLNMTSDSIGVNWAIVGLDFGMDTMVNNNPKLALRIRFAGNTSLTSGNNRFDNFTVEGNIIDTTTPPPPPPIDTFTLIHYWHFNSLNSAYHNPGIPAIDADFSAIDTSKAQIVYALDPGTSASYAGYIDNVTGDTLNAKMLQPAGNGLRVRNPSDSMSLLFYIPTNHYKDIHVKYEVSSSSLTSGQLQENFDYSVDSGATWTTGGLNMTNDSIGVNWAIVGLDFGTDTMVNNNGKLVFRVRFAGNTNLSSGNNRFDNVTVEGNDMDSVIIPPPPPDTTVLIHYWHFNNFTTTYHNPGIPAIDADYSVLDTSKAQVVYQLDPGTDPSYAGYLDPVTGDILNARMAQPAGNGLRVRNPSDSVSLLLYIPTTHYKNIRLKYEVEASSLTSGMLQENFDYSVDSGLTWKTAGLNKTSDSMATVWKLESFSFSTDTTVNNNAALVFRIRFAGNTSLTSGNNRIDNITVEGDTLTAATDTGNYVTTIQGAANTCTLYPNPAGDNIYISTPADDDKTIVIYNLAGQKVYMAQRNGKLITLPVSGLKAGMYYVILHDELNGENYTTRFIKQ